MRLYRISKKKYALDLSGEGARLAGGRWNSPGVRVVYTALSASLAAMEAFVHLPPRLAPPDLMLTSLELPSDSPVMQLDHARLPRNWASYPALPALAAMGDEWAREEAALALRVPSAVVPFGDEGNVLLNPAHSQFRKVKIVESVPFRFDSRMIPKPPKR